MVRHKDDAAKRLGKLKPCDGVEMSLQRRKADSSPASFIHFGSESLMSDWAISNLL